MTSSKHDTFPVYGHDKVRPHTHTLRYPREKVHLLEHDIEELISHASEVLLRFPLNRSTHQTAIDFASFILFEVKCKVFLAHF